MDTTVNEKIAQFIITNSTLFKSKDVHPENKLYFLADTEEIYRGDVPFTTGIIFYSGELPVSPAERKLYINQETLAGYTWSNGTWNTVIEKLIVISEIKSDSNLTAIPNVEAIKKYIRTAISDMTYDYSKHSLNYTQGDIPKSVVIEGIVTGAEYDNVTNILSFKNTKNEIAFTVKLPKDNFPVKGYYDETLKAIILQMRSSEVGEDPYELQIPAADLIKINISKVEGNILKEYDDGFGAVLDISGKADKVPEGADGRIITAKKDGNLNAINKYVGGTYFSLTELPDGRKQADSNILATEAGVMHAITEINENITALNQYVITQEINKTSPSETKYPSESAAVKLYNEVSQILGNISTNMNTISTSVSKQSNDISSLSTDNNNINTKLDSLNEKINNDIVPSVEKISTLERNISTNSQSINTLSTTTTELSKSFNEIDTKFKSIQETFESIVSDSNVTNDELKTEMEGLKSSMERLSTVQTTIERNFSNQIKELQDGLEALKTETYTHINETSFVYYT